LGNWVTEKTKGQQVFNYSITQLPNYPISQSKKEGAACAAPLASICSCSEHLDAFDLDGVFPHCAGNRDVMSLMPF
jgi:hypothetical protein